MGFLISILVLMLASLRGGGSDLAVSCFPNVVVFNEL